MSLPEVQDTDNLMNGFQGYDQSHEDFMSTCVRCRKSTDAATKIGFGGFAYVARVLGMSRRTIYTGIGELEAMGNEDHPPQRPRGGAKRIRRPGGGRRQVTQRQPRLGEVVDEVLEAHSAGSPTDEAVRWTNLDPVQLALARGYHISRNTAAKLLARPGYRRR